LSGFMRARHYLAHETHVWRLGAGIGDVDEGETVVGQAFAACRLMCGRL